MALKATIFRATVQLADMDRNLYGDHELTIARHPSETDERMMVCLLAFALNVPADEDHGSLTFAKDMWEPDEPALWQRDLTGQIEHWIEVGQPDEKRTMQASSHSKRASVYSFSASTSRWWGGIKEKMTRCRNLALWHIPSVQSQALSALAERSMLLDVTVQDGAIWIGNGKQSVEVSLDLLFGKLD